MGAIATLFRTLFMAIRPLGSYVLAGFSAIGLDKVVGWFQTKEDSIEGGENPDGSVNGWSYFKLFLLWLLPLGSVIVIVIFLWKGIKLLWHKFGKKRSYRRKRRAVARRTARRKSSGRKRSGGSLKVGNRRFNSMSAKMKYLRSLKRKKKK